MQQLQVFIYCKITLHVSGVYRTHHQEYIKLKLQLLVQVIVSEQQPSASVAFRQLQFDVLLMMGAIDTRNM